MRQYPTVQQVPSRKQRKSLRKTIFWENRLGEGRRRQRALERKPGGKR